MFKIKKLFKLSVLAVLLLAATHTRAEIDAKIVASGQDYLNGLTGLEAEFLQRSNGGNAERGEFYLQKPGKIRLNYSKMPVQLVSDGSGLYFYDGALDQLTTIPSSFTPASILTAKTIDFKKSDVSVIETRKFPGGFDLKLVMKDNPGLGEIRLIFSDGPVKLAGWDLIDATGNTTEIVLEGLKTRNNFPKGFWSVERSKDKSQGTGDSYYE